MLTSEQHHVTFEYFQGDITDVCLGWLLTLYMYISDFERISSSSEQDLSCSSSIPRKSLYQFD